MMNKFAIYKKNGKFYWSANKIYYCTLFTLLGLGYIFQNIFKPVEKISYWLAIATLIIGVIIKIRNSTLAESLQGTLEGDLIFSKEEITINEKSYSLTEIIKIKINNDDYIGKLINSSKGNIGPALSNGTNNSVILFLKSKETKVAKFELINSDDIQKIRTILIEYHLKEKIDFWELANVLGEKSSSEIKDLTEEITKNKHYR
ncbi:hypothetical protein MW871_15810 [Flavobacterium sp. I-SCBP12n]|uniref:Uncharacterized protein n=1 Tax=Flavobacterium pygoscelis TaxID=2893176 RepID=A0A9X1XUA2_9FLAO|nr:hypothetical protein [Flavobacterium pygoscelis]MCK8143357.1 hypothetical protein [Flavobacterium pygoscelis]